MTEAGWLAAAEPLAMLAFVADDGRGSRDAPPQRGRRRPPAPRRGGASERKLRLFGCGCCRRLWHLLEKRSRLAVETAEAFADGLVGPSGLAAASSAARAAVAQIPFGKRPRQRRGDYGLAARSVLELVDSSFDPTDVVCSARGAAITDATAAEAEEAAQAVLLRDVLGPLPYRAVRVDPACLNWNRGTVAELARAAYEHRRLPEGTLDPARLGVLADALEEAGCVAGELFRHLRGRGPHYRGCWAVDSLLGKK